LEALRSAVADLDTRHSGLQVRFDTDQFLPVDQPLPLQATPVSDDAAAALSQLRQQLAQDHSRGLQVGCLHQNDIVTHLLLACHPLLLDATAMLSLASQVLGLAAGNVSLDSIHAADAASLNRYAQWSAQVLEQKFLAQEWSRLKPRSLDTMSRNKPQPGVQPQYQSLYLNNDFVQARLGAGESVKNWVGDTVHRCLQGWLSHQEILYWFSAPQLRDEQFETLPGFFPYFVPVISSEREPLPCNQRLSRLHTRFSAVSEQLSLDLCRQSSNSPMVHYHWFEADTGASPIQVSALAHYPGGLLMAPLELQITELLDGVCLDVHFDPAQIGADQVTFLLRDLHAFLREEKEVEGAARPTLHERLRQIWKDLLQKSEIGDDQSFFELGGHSLQVTELKFRIRQQLKLDVPISVLYELTTINKLANFILATHGTSLGWSGNTTDSEDEEEEGVL
ncbi:MAG TPA: acyl carrier protein, partial [Dongiaceae bacterium]|nr:acyl carrier protein [Dongiaceae bacterium]